MLAELTRKDKLLLGSMVPVFLAVFALHVHETARTGLAQLPVFAEWVPGEYPRVGGYRLETDSSGSGLELGDRLIRVGDRDLRGVGYIGFHAIGLARTTPGNPVPLVFERDGVRQTVALEARPHPHRWARVPVLLVIPLVCVLILLRAPGSLVAQRFFVGFMFYAIGQSHFYGGPEWKSWAAAGVWNVAGPAMMWGVLRWVRSFPAEMPEERRFSPLWEWLVPALYVVFVRLNYVLAWPLPLAWVPPVSFAAHGISALAGVALLASNYARAYPAGRRRIRWILLGTALGSVPVCAAGLAPLLFPGWDGFRGAFAVGFVTSALWLGGAMLAVVRDNAFDVDRLIGATAAWALAAGAAIVVLVAGAPLLAGTLSSAFDLEANTVRVALAAALGALVIPLGARLRPQVDRVFFPERIALQEAAVDLTEELGRLRSPDEMVAHAAARMAEVLDADGHALYTRGEQRFVRRRAEGLTAPGEVPLDVALPQRAAAGRLPAALQASSAALVVPIRREEGVGAFALLGPKRSGDIYTRDEARVLAGVAAQVEHEWLRFDKQAVERDSRAKTDLLAAASHDLRQPLHAVSLFTEALAGRLGDESARALVERIGASTQELDEMLTSLLDLSKLDAGAVRPEVQTVALSPLFDQLERDFTGPAQAKGLELRVVPTALAVHSDRLLLLRILRNLVSNAVPRPRVLHRVDRVAQLVVREPDRVHIVHVR